MSHRSSRDIIEKQILAFGESRLETKEIVDEWEAVESIPFLEVGWRQLEKPEIFFY
jgi:hypothetical protein